MKITFVVGLPCSGKTYFLQQQKNSLIIDDPTNFSDVVKQISDTEHKNIFIADCNFCIKETLHKAITLLENFFSFEKDFVFFGNNPQKCLTLMKVRNDGRQVEQYIKHLSKIYCPPPNQLTIFQP